MNGGAGNDLFLLADGEGDDVILGGDGFDTLRFTGSAGDDVVVFGESGYGGGPVNLSANGTSSTALDVESFIVLGGDGNDSFDLGDITAGTGVGASFTFTAGAGNDTLDGSAASNRIVAEGGDGNDVLTGGAANDTLDGGAGNDILEGGGGNDLLLGGAGNDTAILRIDAEAGGLGAGSGSFDGGAGEDTASLLGGFGDDVMIVTRDGDTASSVSTQLPSSLSAYVSTHLGTGLIVEGDGAGGFIERYNYVGRYSYGAPTDFSDVALADIDGDGDLDAVLSSVSNNFLGQVAINDGGGNFSYGGSLGYYYSHALAVGDVNGDGFIDVFVAVGSLGATPGPHFDRVLLNDGAGNFTGSGATIGGGDSHDVVLFDIDGDLDLDAVTVDYDYGAVNVLVNDGNGNFTSNGQSLGVTSAYALAFGDLNGDGIPDLYVGGGAGNGDAVFFNDGSGAFTDSGQALNYSNVGAVAIGDLDGDGDNDVFVASRNGASTIWFNDGAGNLTESYQGHFLYANDVALGDIDGDGDLDVVSVGDYGRVLYNDGNGAFSQGFDFGSYGSLTGVALGFLDGPAQDPSLTLENIEFLVIDGGSGNDILDSGAGISSLIGGDGNDVLRGGFGLIATEGGEGNDTVQVGQTDGVFAVRDNGGFGSGGDELDLADIANDPAAFAFVRLGNGMLMVSANEDSLVQPDEDRFQIQIVDFEDGMTSDAGIEAVQFFTGGSVTFSEGGSFGNDLIVVASHEIGGATVSGGFGNDVIFAGARSGQVLSGDSGNDDIVGSVFSEIISGGSGDDILTNGGGGNDIFSGGGGNDTFEISATTAFPFSTTIQEDADFGPVDQLFLDGSFQVATVIASGNDMILFDDLGNDVTVVDQFSGSGAGMERFFFGDFHDMGIGADLYRWSTAGGSTLDDFVMGTSASATIASGGAGDDLVLADENYGFAVLSGGDGDDILGGGDSAVAIFMDGGNGFDIVSYRQFDTDLIATLDGGDGNGTVNKGAGTDILLGIAGLLGGIGNDIFTGSAGDNLLDGGGGDDVLNGGAGNDVYIVRSDGGQDVVVDSSGNDTLRILDGHSASGSSFVSDALNDGNDLILTDGAGSQVTVTGQYAGGAIETIEFSSDGGAFAIGIAPSAGNDFIAGQTGNDTVDGGEGSDALFGHDGDDVLSGEAGDDFLVGGAGSDILNGGDGNDGLSGGSGNDSLIGGAGNDELYGGTGNDQLVGGSGDDVYEFDLADGSDNVINDVSGVDRIETGDNVELFDGTIRIGDDLRLEFNGGGMAVDIIGHFAGTPVEALTIDGYVFRIGTGTGLQLEGSDFADLLVGTNNADDVINGGANRDLLVGGGGNDTITGGAGDDFMSGGAGADAFVYESTDDLLHVTVNGQPGSLFADGAPMDTIADFTQGQDSLLFTNDAWSALGGPIVEGVNFSIIAGPWDGTDAGTNSQFSGGGAALIFSQADSVLYYDDNGSSAGYYAVASMDQPGVGDIQGPVGGV
jgi:Ca2+-binding RTX toxin-like protein